MKFLLNFNTYSKKCFTQQQALHEIICSTRHNEYLPRLILISSCTAETCCPRDPHLGLTFLSGAIRFSYLGEKWHLLKILKHATLGWDLDSSLENNSRLCSSLSTAGQHGSHCQGQGAIRWQIPQTGSSTVTLKVRPGFSPDWNPWGPAPVFSCISDRPPKLRLLGPGESYHSLCLVKFPLGRGLWGYTRKKTLLARTHQFAMESPHTTPRPTFWKFGSDLFYFSFPVCEKTWQIFNPPKAKPSLRFLRSSHGKQEKDGLHLWLEERGLCVSKISQAWLWLALPLFTVTLTLTSSPLSLWWVLGFLLQTHTHAHQYIKHKWS